ncbi:MAG: hypothetical protein ACYC9Q_10460 [Bacillota bacterium]
MPKSGLTQHELINLGDCVTANEIIVKKGEFFAGLVQDREATEMMKRHCQGHERHIQDLVKYMKSSTTMQ